MNSSIAEIALAVAMTAGASDGVQPEELMCLSKNVYHEARGESELGMAAVAQVTLNRAASPRFPNTVCGVVKEDRGSRPHDCQFSWWCDGKSDVIENQEVFEQVMLVSLKVMTGRIDNPVPGATHYYAHNKVTPAWSHKLAEIAVIGDHRFMQE